MFVPKAKREYGYYVLPILRGDRLIGRIEPVFDRRSGTLRVNGVWAEPGAPADAGAAVRASARSARRLARGRDGRDRPEGAARLVGDPRG